MEEKRVGEKTNPVENHWEIVTRLKEIIAENDEKWKKFDTEKQEIRKRYREKEERFERIREKKRKWSERTSTKESITEEKKEIKNIEHYEMWWNLWERRRGRRTSLERSIEIGEEKLRRERWEKEEYVNRENEIGLVWKEFEETLENIDMDEIWKEEYEPKEEEQKERRKKKPRLDVVKEESENVGWIANTEKEDVYSERITKENEREIVEEGQKNTGGRKTQNIVNVIIDEEKEGVENREREYVKGENKGKYTEK